MSNQPGETPIMEFQERLQQKQRDAATRALLDAIVEDPTQSISSVMDTLETDTEASYFGEVFKELSLGQIWFATLTALVEGRISSDTLRRSLGDDAPLLAEKLSALVSAMSGGLEEDAEVIVRLATPEDSGAHDEDDRPRKRKGKKGKKAKAKADGADADEVVTKPKTKKKKAPTKPTIVQSEMDFELDLSDPKIQKSYNKSIMSYLSANGCTDFESGAPAQKIREVVGGSPKQLRDELAALIAEEKITYDGKARGTKYFIL